LQFQNSLQYFLFVKNPVGPLPPPPAPPIQSFNVWVQQQQEIHLRDQIIQQQQQQIQQLEQRVLQLENMLQLSSEYQLMNILSNEILI
jgi:hypothetical protein